MSESSRRLLLHIGMGKTGTSALQVAFARSRDRLASNGINYPRHTSDVAATNGEVVSGNGMGILEAVGPRSRDPDEAMRSESEIFDQSTRPGFHTTLYSSEFLYMFSPDHVQSLHQRLLARGVQLQAVVYVRNMVGHAVSSYSQAVKRRLYTGTFRDYIDRSSGGPYRPVIRPKLRVLRDLLGDDHLRVLHYESVRDRLVPHFYESVLGLDAAQFESETATERINRSLTVDEIALMRYVNRSLEGKRQAHLIGDVIISQTPLGSARQSLSAADHDLLCQYYESDIAWVNDVFFPDTRPLTIAADDVVIDEVDDTDLAPSPREHFLINCLVDLTKRQAGSTASEQ